MSWKLSCVVLRGGESGDARTLPDQVALVRESLSLTLLRDPLMEELLNKLRKLEVMLMLPIPVPVPELLVEIDAPF